MSSYATSLSSLVTSASVQEVSNPAVLAVSQEASPGEHWLPGSVQELNVIREAFPPQVIRILEGPDATKKAFLNEVTHTDIVHLACHGIQHPLEPLKSAIILYNGPVTISRLMKMEQQAFKSRYRLAFLSACQTAQGEKSLPAEFLHLAASFTFAGFSSVIGTMW